MSIVAGGAGTVMSGGTLVIAGVAVSVKGVVLGGAMTAAGGAIASRAVAAMGDDWDMYAFYRSAESSNISNIYSSIKNAPTYPKNFEPIKNGIKKVNMNNFQLIEKLRSAVPGKWKKVYNNGYVGNKKVSIHYFEHEKTGKVFSVKVHNGWSTW
ncbi:MAG: hypothetical protein FWH04_04465 [Oscillospiraceae bacterium]|nr:hypothetical protein [Oscillospiraceae bacterium]